MCHFPVGSFWYPYNGHYCVRSSYLISWYPTEQPMVTSGYNVPRFVPKHWISHVYDIVFGNYFEQLCTTETCMENLQKKKNKKTRLTSRPLQYVVLWNTCARYVHVTNQSGYSVTSLYQLTSTARTKVKSHLSEITRMEFRHIVAEVAQLHVQRM